MITAVSEGDTSASTCGRPTVMLEPSVGSVCTAGRLRAISSLSERPDSSSAPSMRITSAACPIPSLDLAKAISRARPTKERPARSTSQWRPRNSWARTGGGWRQLRQTSVRPSAVTASESASESAQACDSRATRPVASGSPLSISIMPSLCRAEISRRWNWRKESERVTPRVSDQSCRKQPSP
eukprot:scaffold118539_cov31-Tisochrysis_lutea.AAC.6